MTMKVLVGYRYGILGGVCTQLVNRLAHLECDGGIEAHLLFATDYGISTTLGDHTHLHFEPDPARVRELALQGGFDAAVVIDTPEFLEALDGIGGLPLVVEVHTTVERGLAYLAKRSWKAAGYIVPSDYSRRMLRERFEVPARETIEVVPNCLDMSLFPRVDLPVVPRRPIYLWVGKLDEHKNWRGFLDIASRITEDDRDNEFWLVGGYTAPAAAERALIDEMAQRGLTSRCRWLPRVEYGAMHKLYAAVRQSGGAVVVSSINESFGMSVLESLVCGCPVVSTRVGALPEIAPDQPYLRFYDLGDWDEAARLALSMRGENGREVRDLLERARPGLEESYGSRVVAKRYAATLQGIVEAADSGAKEPEPKAAAPAVEPPAAPAPAPPEASELLEAVNRLRAYHPHPVERDAPPVEFLNRFRALQNHRSYRLARLFAGRGRGLRFWLSLPLHLLRLVTSR